MDCIPGTDIEKPTVQLVGSSDNAFAIMGNVKKALKRAGAPAEVLAEYMSKSTDGDYDNLLRVAMEYADVE